MNRDKYTEIQVCPFLLVGFSVGFGGISKDSVGFGGIFGGLGGFQWDFRGAQWDVCLFAVLCGNVGPPLVSCSLETGEVEQVDKGQRPQAHKLLLGKSR